MVKTLVAFLFCLTSTIANAQALPDFRQVPKQVLCGPTVTIIKVMSDPQVNEQPLWIGRSEGGATNFVIFSNKQTGAFTVVQMAAEIGCILGMGHESQQFSGSDPGKPM